MRKAQAYTRILTRAAVVIALLGNAAWGQVIPPAGFLPLNQIPVPQPPNLSTFVKNVPAAIKLGKALF